MARRSLNDIMAAAPDIDQAKLAATTDEDVRRYKAAEGYGPNDRPAGAVVNVPSAAGLRESMGLTQEAFARLLRISVATLRNWEQERKLPDPAARTLLALVSADPENARRILGGEAIPDQQRPAEAEEANITFTSTQVVDMMAFEPANMNLIISEIRVHA